MTATGTRPARGKTRSGATKAKLERRRILQAGAGIIERSGLEQLSMRKLGMELGVEAMSLYRYVPSRENLVEEIVETFADDLYKEIGLDRQAHHGWQNYVRHLAHGLRGVALAHPRIFTLIATRPATVPGIRPPLRNPRCVESFLAALVAEGFTDEQAVAAYRGFNSFLLGHLLPEVSTAGASAPPQGIPRPGHEQDPNDCPVLHRARDVFSQDRSAQEFEDALAHLVDRIARAR